MLAIIPEAEEEDGEPSRRHTRWSETGKVDARTSWEKWKDGAGATESGVLRDNAEILRYNKNGGDGNSQKRIENSIMTIPAKQIGRKCGKHMAEWGLDPSSPEDREKFVEITNGIKEHADEERIVEWLPDPITKRRTVEVKAYIRGTDVVLTRMNGEYLTTMKNGAQNKRVKGGR